MQETDRTHDLDAFMDNAPIGMCFLDGANLRATAVNRKFLDTTGRTKSQVLDKHAWDIFPGIRQLGAGLLKDVIAHSSPLHADHVKISVNRSGHQEEIIVSLVCSPVSCSADQASAICIWLQEDAQPAGNEQKKNEEQRKNDFISMVSHELKTPLTSISGFLQLLDGESGELTAVVRAHAFSQSRRQVRKMTGIINSFLNVSRFETGKIQIEKTDFNFALLLKELAEEALVMYPTHRFEFSINGNESIHADREKIGQAISNFLSNAVRYSPQGSIIQLSSEINNGLAMVTVRDPGIGIRAEELPYIFDRFSRVGKKRVSGFGIGLYICEEIINRHQGRIWVDSTVGKGSSFHFLIPVAGK